MKTTLTALLLAVGLTVPRLTAADQPADLSKPVQVFILLGQSNMVGLGKVTGPDGSLDFAVKNKKKYQHLVDAAGNWSERTDVRNVRVMVGRSGGMQLFNNEFLKVTGKSMGPEYGIGHPLGDAVEAPVMLLKSCIGNRSLGWDLLPPGSERYVFEGKVYAGYKDRPDTWPADAAKGTGTTPPPWVDKAGKPIEWYAGKHYEVAGFFFWQGEKDGGNAGHAAKYEENLVRFIKQLRKDFDAPRAKFVLATLGEATKGSTGNGGKVLEAQLAVDGANGKYPEFKGNVATVYANPLSKGGSGNSHYNGNAETYMDVGEAMGKAMADLLKNK